MKFLAWFSGILASVLVGAYVVVFTPFGNSLIQPLLDAKIKEQTKLESKLTTFSLSMSTFSVVLELDKNNIIYANGSYSLFSQAFNIVYRTQMKRLESLEALTELSLRGALYTEGRIKGDLKFIEIDGISDIAKSDTNYHIELSNLKPTSIIAKVENLQLEQLLYMSTQKSYASADVNLDINFKNIKANFLDGDILLRTTNGKINTKVMKKDFEITLPHTNFTMSLDAKLKGEAIDYNYILNSNLAKMNSSGRVIPEALKTDIRYSIDIKELAVLKPLTNAPLRGSFATDGIVKGDKQNMLIDGKSNIAESKTNYKINLVDFKPMSVLANIKDAKVQKLLYMLGESNYASSDLDAIIKLTSLDPQNLAGDAKIKLSNGFINSKIMKKLYQINIPQTSFDSKMDVNLKGKNIDYKMAFNSNLVNLNSKGNFVPQNIAMNIVYDVDIKELAVLKPITGLDARGAFRLKGRVKGDKKSLVVDSKSDFASSDTTFKATLKEFTPSSIKVNIKNLKLAKALYMFKQPHYGDGIFSLDVDIDDARSSKLSGVIRSNITNGVFDSKYITKAFKFETKMPRTTFKMNTETTLDSNILDTKIDFDSSLANLDIKKVRFNIDDSSLKSDYLINIKNLDKFYFATARDMKGAMAIEGEFKKAKDIDVTIISKIAGGKIDAKLHNDDFHADLVSLQTFDILHILTYPEIIKSQLNGILDYNLAKEKGKFTAKLSDGKFTKNQMFGLIKKYANVDLHTEQFKGNIIADIKKEKIVSSLDLISRTSSIKTNNTRLNTKTKLINSTIAVVANKHPVTVHLKGNINSPSISLDLEKLMKSKTGDVLKKEASKLFRKLFK